MVASKPGPERIPFRELPPLNRLYRLLSIHFLGGQPGATAEFGIPRYGESCPDPEIEEKTH